MKYGFLNFFSDALAHMFGALGSGIHQEQHVFIAAVPETIVEIADVFLKNPADILQNSGTHEMAFIIIDLFKVIDVHKEYRKWSIVPLSPADLGVESKSKIPLIV